MEKPTTLSIGGATFDLFVRLKHDLVHRCKGKESIALDLGKKIKVDEVIEAQGGGACNTSIGLSRLGCSACFSGVIGDDQWGQMLLSTLKREGVDTSCITVVEDEVSSFSIILSASSGERVILYDPGTNEHLHDVTFNREVASGVDWVYLNHIQESTCVIQDDLIEIFKAGEKPGLTWNPGGCQLDMGLNETHNRELLAHTNVLLVNKQEAMQLAKTEDDEEALKKILATGVKNIFMTDGGNGAVALDGKNRYHCPVLSNVKVVDTTGAGDAFGTGVTWAMINNLDLPSALKAGTINAASVVSNTGAQTGLLTDTDMKNRLRSTELNASVNAL